MHSINKAVSYLEQNLTGEIDVSRAAGIMGLSEFHFRRMFSIVVGIPVGEYIRRRRLTQAAKTISEGSGMRIIDLAVLYGYGSADSFTRAFTMQHGVTPQIMRTGKVNMCAYPRLTLQMKIKGDVYMKYRIEKKSAFKAFGRTMEIIENGDEKQVPAFFEACIRDGTFDKIRQRAHETYSYPDQPTMSGISNIRKTDNGYVYMVGALCGEKEEPEEFECVRIPESTWAVFQSDSYRDGDGDTGIIQSLWRRIYQEWLPTSGYRVRDIPEVEQDYYDNPEACHVEIWIPVVKTDTE